MDRAADYDFGLSNEELLELCKRQDQEALRVLFRRHERPVYGLLFRMLSSHEDAEEALAEVFVKVWRAAAGFKQESKFTTWLFRIAANTARDILRSRKARQEVFIEDTVVDEVAAAERAGSPNDPEAAAIVGEERAMVVWAMGELGEEDRLLVGLYHLQDLDYGQIAEITGIPPQNLKVKLFRARQRMRKLVAERERGGNSDEVRSDTTGSTGLRQGAAEWA